MVKLSDKNGTIAHLIESMRDMADFEVPSADHLVNYYQQLQSIQPVKIRFDNTGK